MSDTSVDALTLVKPFTKEKHSLLESKLDLMRSSLSLRAYAELLDLFLSFYQVAETKLTNQLSSVLQNEIDLSGRLKSSKLKKDLDILTYTLLSPSSQWKSTSAGLQLAALQTEPELLGMMYVLEGATLGGQLISRHFEKTLGEPFVRASNFYRGYGLETGLKWKTFRETVNQRVTSSADKESFCRAADTTFAALAEAVSAWSEARPPTTATLANA